MRNWILPVTAALLAGACGSTPPDSEGLEPPSAQPLAFELSRSARAPAPEPTPDPRSPSRVLGYVEGDVITYREVQQLIGPELAQIDDPRQKTEKEDAALLDIVRERLLFRAATDAGVYATRDEIETERAEFVRDLKKSNATLEAFLHEREMSRREFDEMIRKRLIVSKYRRAAIGHSNDPNVMVRPVTDTYVPPEDVQKYYDRHPEKFHEPPSARCRLLAVKTNLEAPDREKAVAEAKQRADEIRQRLAAGDDWVPVYRSATLGALEPDPLDGLVEMHRGEKAEWIEQFAFGSPKGTLSEVVQKGTTFYILRAEGAHEERTIPFEEASQGVRGMLSGLRSQMAWLEVELSVLGGSSVQPESLRNRVRDTLRQTRLKLQADAGL